MNIFFDTDKNRVKFAKQKLKPIKCINNIVDFINCVDEHEEIYILFINVLELDCLNLVNYIV